MSTTQTSRVTAALARDRLGVPAVVFYVMSGVAPLTVAAGVITTGYAVTGLTGIPAAFIVTALVLGLFAVGYVAMSRHITNAGALYAFVTRGLGRPVGIAVALIATVAYNLLQTGLYGAFGPSAHDYFLQHAGVNVPWWGWALAAWAIVAVLGLLKVDLSGKVLAVLLSAEILVVLAFTITGLASPTGEHLSFATLSPTKLLTPGVGAALVIAVLGCVGFEGSAVFAEEAKNARRTVPVATYLSLGLIALLYGGASWAMAVHYGEGHVAGVAQQQGPGMLFAMSGGFLQIAGTTLFLTSLFAAMIAFHSFVTRYMYVLGREGVLPKPLGKIGRSGSPWYASLVQSLVGFVVICIYAVMGWDPLVKLFFWLGTTGGFGILVLLAVTSFAVIGFFLRNRISAESPWHRWIAPGLAAVILSVMAVLAVRNYATLLGAPPGSAVALWLPMLFGIAGVAGLVWALLLRLIRPDVYAAINPSQSNNPNEGVRDWPIATPSPHWSNVEL